MVHHCTLYSVTVDMQHTIMIMGIVKTTLFLIGYTDSVFCFFAPEKEYSGILEQCNVY